VSVLIYTAMTQRTVKRLWVFADSFGVCDPKKDNPRVWSRQLAKRISLMLNEPIELFNYSLIGCSQDWTVNSFMSFQDQILPDDFVVIVMTSASRYWYFDDMPTLTNWNIIDLDQHVGKERARSVELYLKHIQRPALDHLQSVCRLSLIAYYAQIKGLRNPLIVKAFDDKFNPCDTWSNLDWAKGFLSAIQFAEYADQEVVVDLYNQTGSGYFKGYDCRYNHMCLSNHDILSELLAEQLVNKKVADISTGFKTQLIDKNWYKNEDFMLDELNPTALKYYFENIHSKGEILPWKRRVGVEFLGKFNRTDN